MKKNRFLLLGLALLIGVFYSCEDLQEVEVPNFNVTFSTEVAVGEPVEFKVENTPNFLLFYAGDFGHEYKHRNRVNADGVVTMSFLNSQKWGLGANATGTLSVWYSRDYDGSGTPEGVNNATWTEISDRFDISTLYDLNRQIYTIADITDLGDGNNIYFAFKYFCDNPSERPAEWWLDDLSIQMEVENAPAPFTEGYAFFGWHSFSGRSMNMWIDDIVVSDKKIGCN